MKTFKEFINGEKKSSTLVIHPKDRTTDFLIDIYSDKRFDVINKNLKKDVLIDEINNYDKIIMMGHGWYEGLFNTENGGFLIDKDFVPYLMKKDCVYIWCNASQFVKRYRLKGFYTGMIISEVEEASWFNIIVEQSIVDESNKLFSKAIKNSINLDPKSMHRKAKEIYKIKGSNPVIEYNQKKLFYR